MLFDNLLEDAFLNNHVTDTLRGKYFGGFKACLVFIAISKLFKVPQSMSKDYLNNPLSNS